MFGTSSTPPNAYKLKPQQGLVVPLQTSVSAQFDPASIATAITGPARARHTWRVTRFVTTAGAPGDSVMLTLYRNSDLPGNVIDSTYQGVQATSETDITLLEGERLIAIWTGGSPGTIATLNITGEEHY